jgi:hypothetical protein
MRILLVIAALLFCAEASAECKNGKCSVVRKTVKTTKSCPNGKCKVNR